MTCSKCDKPALRIADGKGFCKDHMADAVKTSLSLGSKATGRGWKTYPPLPDINFGRKR